MLKMEFKTFLNAFMLLPCQIIKTSRKIVYRLLGWNPHLPIFFRLLDALRPESNRPRSAPGEGRRMR